VNQAGVPVENWDRTRLVGLLAVASSGRRLAGRTASNEAVAEAPLTDSRFWRSEAATTPTTARMAVEYFILEFVVIVVFDV